LKPQQARPRALFFGVRENFYVSMAGVASLYYVSMAGVASLYRQKATKHQLFNSSAVNNLGAESIYFLALYLSSAKEHISMGWLPNLPAVEKNLQ